MTIDDETLEIIMEQVIQMVLKKHEDYGNNCIDKTGLTGIAVRLIDKTERLYNLRNKKGMANYESIDDTLRDIIGYALLGIVYQANNYYEATTDDRTANTD